MVKQIIEAGRWVKSAGLSWANSGNISAVQDGAMLITASGTRLDCLTEHDIVPCAGAYDKKPSKEYPMHAAVYAVRPDVKAVLHASPYYTTLYGCMELPLKTNLFIEAMRYLRHVATVPYFPAGSDALAQAVGKAAEKANVVFMRNHGVIVMGKNLQEAFCALEVTEAVCKMNIESCRTGLPLLEVAPQQVREFYDAGYSK